ncbi:Type 1 phosphatases regulator YPI1 [Cladobotryum mycophilum]|uniref:Type 1 phosphatases regulator n=1 Tax=Cladobotryum mycophilum TaxID=491253 RepID=A0ABR0SZ84_9HYPO
MAQISQRERDAQASTTSQTTTAQISQPETREDAPRILRLRGGGNASGRSVQWAEGVVDNEGLGRKSSKVCCIYHRPKGVDESSDESSSDSDSDSDSGADNDRAKPTKGGGNGCGHSHDHKHGRSKKRDGKQKRPPSPNAYERVPKPKPRPEQKEPAATKA